jgi:3-oxoacyl-[acyl-carrier protein] reductase
VGDDQDASTRVRAGDPLDGFQDPRQVLVAGLAVVVLGPGKARLDLHSGQAGPGADIDFAQPAVDDHRHAVRLRDDQRRLVRSAEVARVDGVERHLRELAGERLRLLSADLVQRRVGPALKAAFAVPVGLAVPRQKDGGHAGYASGMDLGLRGRACLVTGSTGGIGLETARMLIDEEARVVTNGRRDAPGVGEIFHVRADLSLPGQPERVVAEAVEALGGLDVLVNNVGIARQARFEEVFDEEWDAYWQLNVMSYVRTIRAVLPHLRAAGDAAIVNVSSTSGKRPSTSMPHYSVTKAAVLSLSRLVADIYAKDGIRCNAVTPGPTATEAWLGEGGLADQQGDRAEVLAKVGAGRPLGRLARPEEIAAVVVFLCSKRAAYVTGAAWSADGGTVPIII